MAGPHLDGAGVGIPSGGLGNARLFCSSMAVNEFEPIPYHRHNKGGQDDFTDTQTKHNLFLPGICCLVNK